MTQQNIKTKGDFFDNMPVPRQHAIALVILFLIPFFLFTATTIGGKRYHASDSVQWRAMAQSGIEYAERNNGEPALWTTDMFGGMPTYTISSIKAVPHLDDLITRVFYSLFPAYWFWVLFLGLYIFLVCLKVKPLQAVIGCILFGLTTYTPVFIGAGHSSKLVALAFTPWVLLGYWLTAHSKQKLLGLLAFAVALTLEFRAGHPQITYYFIYILFFWWLYDSYTAFKKGETKPWMVVTGLLTVGTLLGLSGSAGHFWKLAEYSPLSIRGGSALQAGASGLDSGYAFAWSQGFMETLTLIIPGLFGGASPDYWGDKIFTSGPHYMGALVLPFLILALMKNRKPIVVLLFGVGTLALIFSWGENFRFFNQLAFDYIPFFNKFRVPETWLILTTFCYSVVGIFGLQWFMNHVKEKKPNSLNLLYIPFGVTLGIAIIFTVFTNSILSYEKVGEKDTIAQQFAAQNNVRADNPQIQATATRYIRTQIIPARQEKAKGDSIRFLILSFLIIGLSAGYMKGKINASVLSFALILIVSYDMISVDKRYLSENSLVDESFDLTTSIERSKTAADTFIEQNVQSTEAYKYRTLSYLSGNPFVVAIPSYFYPSIGGNNGAKLGVFSDLIEQDGPLFGVNGPINTRILSMLNVKYLAIGGNIQLDGFDPVFTNNGMFVFENKKVLPKAFFVDSLVAANSPVEAYELLKATTFDAADVAIVEGINATSLTADSLASVKVTEYDNHTITLETDRSTPGFMVLSEIYYPKGWTASIDGEPLAIVKTNYALRGVQVPAGKHTINFNFAPTSHIWGSRIEWGSNLIQLGIAAFVLLTLFRKKEESDDEA